MSALARREYERHRPEETVLYEVVRLHLESFLAHVNEHSDKPLPRYVINEFRQYLQCGILAHGFGRAKCCTCGHEIFVAFSCKLRGACPSCNARRMCGTAAHLVDCVLPDVDTRQWVLSVPFELRVLLAARPKVLSAVGRIFAREIQRWQRQRALALGYDQVHCGAIAFPHRFGASLNLNVHFHVVVPDAVFVISDDEDRARELAIPPPKRLDLEEIVLSTAVKVVRWLDRRGYLGTADQDPDTQGAAEQSPLMRCLLGSLGVGDLQTDAKGEESGRASKAGKGPKPKSGQGTASYLGFNVHAAVSVGAGNAEARERLLRYCCRAPLSLKRLAVRKDGAVTYQVKAARNRPAAVRVMTPIDFLARLSALIPPPRHPLIRFHGVFAPHHKHRAKVVPVAASTRERTTRCEVAPRDQATTTTSQPAEPRNQPAGGARAPAAEQLATPASATGGHLVPTITAALTPSTCARIPWAVLLKRIHDVDALKCSECGDRMRFVEVIEDEALAQQELERLGLPSQPPPLARARAPDWAA